MIKIGTKKDLYKIAHLPINVQNAIKEDISILDDSYGENRNVDRDMGGFVVVCEQNESLKIANFEKEFLHPEFSQVICPYAKTLYIAGTERNIVIYERMENYGQTQGH